MGAHPLPSKLERVTRLPTFQAARIFTVNHTAMDVFWGGTPFLMVGQEEFFEA